MADESKPCDECGQVVSQWEAWSHEAATDHAETCSRHPSQRHQPATPDAPRPAITASMFNESW